MLVMEILLHLLPAHADAVIGNGDGTLVLVPGDGNGKILPGDPHLIVGKGGIGQLINGIGSVGQQLPEENLFIGIDRIDHQIQKSGRLGLELFLFHNTHSFRILALSLLEC